MKNVIENIKNFFENKDQDSKKTIGFFSFYAIFFLIILLSFVFGGDKNHLLQEYEDSDTSFDGSLQTNYVYDFKVTVDGTLHDYYGKRYGEKESFKYNNQDYYRENENFFVNQDLWVKCDNPYVFYEFIDFQSISNILQKATFIAKTEYESGEVEYHYLTTSNTLNQVLYKENTDYDEPADSIDVLLDSSSNIKKITFQLDQFCAHRENCENTLKVELNFEMHGGVKEIDNPVE